MTILDAKHLRRYASLPEEERDEWAEKHRLDVTMQPDRGGKHVQYATSDAERQTWIDKITQLYDKIGNWNRVAAIAGVSKKTIFNLRSGKPISTFTAESFRIMMKKEK